MRKLLIIFLMTLFALSSFVLFSLNVPTSLGELGNLTKQKIIFNNWMKQFGRNYGTQIQEIYRLNIFRENLLLVNDQNLKYQRGEVLSKLSLNQFSDLTNEQFAKAYLSESFSISNDFQCNGPQAPLQDKFDANFTLDSKMLNPNIGTQGDCAAGYAFATIAAVQSSMYKIYKEMKPMSAQQIIDCSNQTSNTGCNGGNSLKSLQYLINRGAMKDSDYAYTGKTDNCKYQAIKIICQVRNCTRINGTDAVVSIKSAILQQPVIVQFDATDNKFILYGGGLYQPSTTCGSKINHYMLAVGWGQITKQMPMPLKTTYYYLVVKNSFGVSWGQKGFANIIFKKNSTIGSACGMLNQTYFPYQGQCR